MSNALKNIFQTLYMFAKTSTKRGDFKIDYFQEFLIKEERDIQRDRAKELTSMRQENYVGGRLGLIIDGTGKDDGKIQKAKKALEDIGYETRMVFVDTDLETAHERNMERPERSVKPELLTDTFKTCRKVGGKLRRIFDFSKEDFQVAWHRQ